MYFAVVVGADVLSEVTGVDYLVAFFYLLAAYCALGAVLIRTRLVRGDAFWVPSPSWNVKAVLACLAGGTAFYIAAILAPHVLAFVVLVAMIVLVLYGPWVAVGRVVCGKRISAAPQ